MDIITGFAEKVKGKNFSIVLPEGNDGRIIRAARIIKDEDIACPIVLGKPEKITDTAEKASVTLDGIETLNPRTSQKLDEHAQKYITGRDDISLPVAKRVVAKSVFYGAMMVASGDADAMVVGAANATATVIQAGILCVGMAPGIDTPSSFFLRSCAYDIL